jgi:hypothetical protein
VTSGEADNGLAITRSEVYDGARVPSAKLVDLADVDL